MKATIGCKASLATLCLGACVRLGSPTISTTHYKMVDPIRVEARYDGMAIQKGQGALTTNLQFTIERPLKYNDKRVTYDTYWIEFDTSRLMVGKTYTLTVPQQNIDDQESVCGWGLELRE